MDTYRGLNSDPISLHKYLYVHANPINGIDPSGMAGLFGFSAAQNVNATLTSISLLSAGYDAYLYGTGAKDASAKNVGMTVLVLLAGPVAGKAVGAISAARATRVLEAGIKSGNIASIFVRAGRTSQATLRRFIPKGVKNTFIPSNNISAGYKYQWRIGGVRIEVKWHSPDLNALARFPDSNSGTMWTAQIKIKNKLIGTDGKLYRRPNNKTHIPIDLF